jgi:hypothetical protein
MGALVVVESIRIDKGLCFARIGPDRYSGGTESDLVLYFQNRDEWWERFGLPKANEAFRSWFNADIDWETKRKLNPLKGSALDIQESCG